MCTEIPTNTPAELIRCESLSILRIKGTPESRARQIGTLVRQKQLAPDTLEYFSTIFDRKLERLPGIARAAATQVYALWRKVQQKPDRENLAGELKAFAEEAGMDFKTVRKGIGIPDFAVFLSGLTRGKGATAESLPDQGCTSVARSFDDGSFVVGRNLDFSGVRVWDTHPFIVIAEPEEGAERELRHIALSGAPLFLGSITGVNEAGITVATHQNFTKDVTGAGVPVYFVGETVLRRARTIEQAIAVLRETRPGPLWTFVITDLNSRQAVAVEASAHHFFVRKMEGAAFAQTNHLLAAPAAEAEEIENIPFTTLRNSRLRHAIALEALKKATPERRIETALEILAYQPDRLSADPSHRDILKADTIQTALFERTPAGEPRVYLGMDPAPTPSGRFVRLSLDRIWASSAAEPLVAIAEVVDPLATPRETRERQLRLADAYVATWDQDDPERAIELLRELPGPGAALIRAILYYELERYGEARDEAEATLQTELAKPESARDTVVIQSLRAVSLLSRYRLHPEDTILSVLARELGKSDPVNPSLEKITKRLRRGQPLTHGELKISYDWFSGDLRWGGF